MVSEVARRWHLIIFHEWNSSILTNQRNGLSLWIRWFEYFCEASGVASKFEQSHMNYTDLPMGPKVDNVFQSFRLSKEDGKKYSGVGSGVGTGGSWGPVPSPPMFTERGLAPTVNPRKL